MRYLRVLGAAAISIRSINRCIPTTEWQACHRNAPSGPSIGSFEYEVLNHLVTIAWTHANQTEKEAGIQALGRGAPGSLFLAGHNRQRLVRRMAGNRHMTHFSYDIEALIVTFLWLAAVAIILSVLFW